MPKTAPCPECGEAGAQVIASSPLLPENVKTQCRLEYDAELRLRMKSHFGFQIARRADFVTGADLDKFCAKFGIKRKGIER